VGGGGRLDWFHLPRHEASVLRGVRLLMDDPQTVAMLRKQLREQINKVPDSVRNGSIQTTRSWVAQRNEAMKVLNKPNSTATQLMSAINSIK
jgi:hypothetical protein